MERRLRLIHVERLRLVAESGRSDLKWADIQQICKDAAEEIERLQARVEWREKQLRIE